MSNFKLRHYQEQAFNAVIDAIVNKKINPLVESAAGTGKSVMIASVIAYMFKKYPNIRILCLADKKELVDQNCRKLLDYAGIHAGVHCAGLGKKDYYNRVIFASIGSIADKRKLKKLGTRHLILVDEPHTIPDDKGSMYRRAIDHFKNVYPTVKIAGYTATPYRLKTGRLDEGEDKVFDQTVFTYSIKEGVADGYLCPLISKRSLNSIDLTRARKNSSGEINIDSIANEVDSILDEAINEFVALGEDRNKWIIFTPSIKVCQKVFNELKKRGIPTGMITGDTPDRDKIIKNYKSGKIKALVNVDVLTTGFDVPEIDMIVMLRPTFSTSLYVQMLGRGTRIFLGKDNCLVVDFAGNIRRHGAVDEIVIEPKIKKKKKKKMAEKLCPSCEEFVSINTMTCPTCGFEWERSEEETVRFQAQAEADFGVMSFENRPIERPVKAWEFTIWNNFYKPPSLLITFVKDDFKITKDWLPFEGSQFARNIAVNKWKKLGGYDPAPLSTEEAYRRSSELTLPCSIIEQINGKYINIMDYKK